MALARKVSVDALTNTGSLDVYVGGVLVTTYSFLANGKFKLSERLTANTVTSGELVTNADDIRNWIELCARFLSGYDATWSKSRLTVDDKQLETTVSLKVGNDPEVSAVINKITGTIEFLPRTEMTLKISEMYHWIRYLDTIITWNNP